MIFIFVISVNTACEFRAAFPFRHFGYRSEADWTPILYTGTGAALTA